jgi:hypothetical protein
MCQVHEVHLMDIIINGEIFMDLLVHEVWWHHQLKKMLADIDHEIILAEVHLSQVVKIGQVKEMMICGEIQQIRV